MKIFLFLSVFFTSLGLTLRRPFYGVLLFVGLFYAAPPYHWWGQTIHYQMGIRTSLLASLVLLIAYIIKRGSYVDQNRNIDKFLEVVLYMLMFIAILTTQFAAVSEETSIEYTIALGKLLFFYFLMARLIGNGREMQAFVWINLFGCFYFGWEAFSGNHMVGGRLEGLGGPGIAEAEGLAAHISIFIPYLGLYLLSGRKWEKIAVVLMTPFIFNTLILTRTRASFLALLGMAFYFILFCDKKYRAKAIPLMLVGGLLFVYLADPSFWDRMRTLKTYKTEASAVLRLEIWKAGLKMMSDYPFGVGGGNFELLIQKYIPNLDRPRAAHNTYLLVGVEYGIFGLIVFLFFLFRILWIFWRCRNSKVESEEDERRKMDMFGMEVGFIGFLIAAFFVNRFLTDSLYWMAAFAVAGEKIREKYAKDFLDLA